MVVVPFLPHVEFGRNDHREDAPHFNIEMIRFSSEIQLKESKSFDIHGVICETTKLATSDFGICDFELDLSQWFGSFSLKPTNLTDDIKCSQLVQTGF